MNQNTQQLLIEIAQCSVAKSIVDGTSADPTCSIIVKSQGNVSWGDFQTPEPWSGHIETAPILYLASNPSISAAEAYPTGAAPTAKLEDFFDSRFGGYWVHKGRSPLNKDLRTYGGVVRYWTCMLNRTTELLGHDAVPGVDYVISEIVHCKSQSQLGVEKSLKTCADRYLKRVLSCSGAVVIVLVGLTAFGYWNSLKLDGVPLVPEREGTDLQEIAGRKRIVCYLADPSGPQPKLFKRWLSPAKIDYIRSLIQSHSSGNGYP